MISFFDFLTNPSYLPKLILDLISSSWDMQAFFGSFFTSTGFPIMVAGVWGTNNLTGSFFKHPMLEISFTQVAMGFILARFILASMTYSIEKKIRWQLPIVFTRETSKYITMLGPWIPLFGWILPIFSAYSYSSFWHFIRDTMMGAIIWFIIYNIVFAAIPSVYPSSSIPNILSLILMMTGWLLCMSFFQKKG